MTGHPFAVIAGLRMATALARFLSGDGGSTRPKPRIGVAAFAGVEIASRFSGAPTGSPAGLSVEVVLACF